MCVINSIVATCCLLLVSVVNLPPIVDAEDAAQALLHAKDDGTLYFESAADQNITFRLMGEASTLLMNDTNLVSLLQRRQHSFARAAFSVLLGRPLLSLDALKEQFRGVRRDLQRLTRRFSIMSNGTRRTQRELRRALQRVQTLNEALNILESKASVDDCKSNPCKNGGSCYDAFRGFQCFCTASWQGPTCEVDVNECFDLPISDLGYCMNGAECINEPGSYRCNCRNGFTGSHCRLRQNTCLSNQSAELCGPHGTCLPASSAAGYVCICDQGWTWADVNATAASASPCTRDFNECAPEIDPCHSECINLPGSFHCAACPPGYTGDGKHCQDIDECRIQTHGCSTAPTVACINTEGSYRCGRCPPGWQGNGRTCTEAKSNSCNGEQICDPRANCEYISGTVVCTCPTGFYGHGYGPSGCTEDHDAQPCDNHRCENNGICAVVGLGTSCICQPGYTGPLCRDSDACHPNPCQNGGTCRLLLGNQYQCICPAGFTGTSCSQVRSYCGAVLRNQTGSIEYPPNSASSGYEASERCAFVIRTRRGYVLNVTFGLFDLQDSPDCSSDFLQLHDGSTLMARQIGRFCGHRLPLGNGSVVTTQDQLFLWFQSDNATHAQGFNLSWTSQPLVCGAELTLSDRQFGVLRSPGYPGKAAQSIDCRWRLSSPYSTRLQLHFYDITLGSTSGNCTAADMLTVLDADSKLYTTCISDQPEPLYSSSNRLTIDFHTNAGRADSAFQLYYQVVAGNPGCGGVFTDAEGIISGNINGPVCLYLIEQPAGMQVELRFQRIKLMSESCALQKLEIFDGSSDEQPLLKRFCGQPEETELLPITSTGNSILIRYEFKLEGFGSGLRYELSYKRLCIANLTYPSGVITTPNYPNGYLENTTCSFIIITRPNTKVRINITDLSMDTTAADQTQNGIYDESLATYLDVHLSRNVSEKRRFFKNMTNMLLVSTDNLARVDFHGARNRNRARGLRMEYTFISSQCGGTMIAPKQSFRLITQSRECRWVIEAPGPKEFSINIVALSVMTNNTINVYDNSTGSEGILLHSYTNENEVTGMSDSSLLTITLNQYSTSVGILHVAIKYEPYTKGCGGFSSARYGVIKSPNWPRRYGASENCTWIINAPLGQQIELVVHNFTLESDCTADYLEIRNGNGESSPLIGRYCGRKIPSRIPSFGNALHVRFLSDMDTELAGFYLHWQTVATGCGGILNSPVGAIHSPHYLGSNRGAVSCDWQITVAQGSTIQLQLNAHDDNLCNGQVTLYDGPNTGSARLPLNCSSEGPSELMLRSSGNCVLVRYDVDNESPDGVSFVLNYTANCKVRLEQLSGAIETPNFPENYPPNTNCEWDIRAVTGGSHLRLAFSHLSMELSALTDQCEFDSLILSDYRDEQLLSETRLCTAKDQTIDSKGNRLLLRFSSDSTFQEQGFHAEYQRIGCGSELLGPGGYFTSPGAPFGLNLDCDWHIIVPEGYQVRLVIPELHIETNQRDCNQNMLTVLGGGNSSAILYRSCHVESSTQILTAPANELHIRFRTDANPGRKYFRATYMQVPATCGGRIIGSNGIITSPNYHDGNNDAYASDVECVWTIDISPGYAYRIRAEAFNLTSSPNCSEASLNFTLIRKDGVSGRLDLARCGAELLPQINFSQNLRIDFKAKAGSYGKFALRYQQSCGGPLYEDEGYMRARLDEVCRWYFTGKQNGKIILNIYQLECSNARQRSGLHISNGVNMVPYSSICEDHPTTLVIPTNNAVVIARGIAFSAQYSTLENSCGGEIRSVRGLLSSPNYPDTYPSNVECIWQIVPPAGNGIEMSLQLLDISPSEHCNGDFLEVRAGLQGALLGLYCGNKLPEQSLYTRSSAWIKFRSLPGSSGKGFKLHWSYLHENEFTNETSGIIEAPPTLAVKNADEPYSWRILSTRGTRVVLELKEYYSGLLLYDGFDDTAQRIRIEASPWQFISSSNVLYLKTRNEEFYHFLLHWHTIDESGSLNAQSSECNQTLIVRANQVVEIKSPGYPHGYSNNLRCEWTLKAEDPTRHVYVELEDVNLEQMISCMADHLSVFSSTNLVNWQLQQSDICQLPTEESKRKINGTPYLQLRMETDSSVNGTGFKAFAHSRCGANMTGAVGTIVGKPFMWARLTNSGGSCEYHIEVRPGRVIDIQIEYNGPAAVSNCHVYGIIHDGIDGQSPLMENGKFCNQVGFATRSYRTSGPHAFIRYTVNGLGLDTLDAFWNLTYREYRTCDMEVRLTDVASSYNISTPGYPYYPHPHSDCTWLVMAPAGETILASFVDDFAMSTAHCDDEYVELFDGSTMISRRLLKTCRRPSTVRSSSNLLLVHYQTELAEPHAGFKLNVSLSRCGGLFTDRQGTIKSEHYPALGGYPKAATCEYIIRQAGDRNIKLNFSDLHLPFDNSQANPESLDRIEILDLSNLGMLLITLYGNESMPHTLNFDTKELMLRFITKQANNKYRGFMLQYSTVGSVCYRDINAVSGILESEAGSGLPLLRRTCEWKITVPKGQRVRLELLNAADFRGTMPMPISPRLRFGSSYWVRRMMNRGLVLYNNVEKTSIINEIALSSYNGSGTFMSTDNFMLVRIGNNLRIGLRARFSSREPSLCPPDIGAHSSGTLTNQELLPLSQHYCTIRFSVQPGETLRFKLVAYEQQPTIASYAKFTDDQWSRRLKMSSDGSLAVVSTVGSITLMREQSDNGSTPHFRATYERHACGGQLELAEGSKIELAQLREDSGELECLWLLRRSSDYLLEGNASFSDSCEREYLSLRSVNSEHELWRLCRDNLPLNLTRLQSSQYRLLYHATDYKASGSQFQLQFTRAQALAGLGSIVVVRDAPTPPVLVDARSYRDNMELSWEFRSNAQTTMRLKFLDRFFIEMSPNCSNDQLEVLQLQSVGVWQPLATYCGRELPAPLLVQALKMRVVFRTNANVTADGFKFVVEPICDIRLEAKAELQHEFRIHRFHRDTNNCSLEFYTPSQQQLLVSIDNDIPCTLAYFEQHGGELQQPVRHCAPFRLHGYHSLKLRVVFLKRPQIAQLDYQLLGCGGNYSAPFSLQPPHSMSGDAINCIWRVQAPPQHAIYLSFKRFQLVESMHCDFAHLSVYKGFVESVPQRVARLCRNLTDTIVMVDNNQALIHANLPSYGDGLGFLASVKFTPNCNERLVLGEGNERMSLTRHFSRRGVNGSSSEQLLCYFRASGTPGQRLSVWLKTLSLNQRLCRTCSALELIDGFDSNSASLGRYYGVVGNGSRFFSTGSDVLIKLTSELTLPLSSDIEFEIVIELAPTVCGQLDYDLRLNDTVKLSLHSGNISSSYGSVHCTWHIKSDQQLELQLVSLQLQSVSQVTGKCIDYLQLSVPFESAKYFCGRSNSTVLYLSNDFDLTFHTQDQESSFDFDIIIRQKTTCNRTHNALSGLIDYNIKDLGYCYQDLLVPQDYFLTLHIYYLSFNAAENNITFNLTDLMTNSTIRSIRSEPQFQMDIDVYAKTNALRLLGRGAHMLRLFYYATPRQLRHGCGGNINTLEGRLMNPNYNNRNYSECIWHLISPAGNNFQFALSEFNMGSDVNCPLDYVKFYEVEPDNSEKLRNSFCGQHEFQVVRINAHHIKIVAKKSPNFDGTGFHIDFSPSG